MYDKFHSLGTWIFSTKFIKHTCQQIKFAVGFLKPETFSHTALLKQWKSLPEDIADVITQNFNFTYSESD